MPACLLPGLALCLLLVPLAGGGRLPSCAVPVGGGVLPGHLGVTALPSLAGAKPLQEEGGTVLLSSLASGVVWVLFLVLGAQSWQKGGRVAVGLWPKLVERKPWVSWRLSPRGRGTGASSLGTHRAGGTPCAPQDQACPPQTPHLGAECPGLGARVSSGSSPRRPHIPPRCFHLLSVSRTTGPDTRGSEGQGRQPTPGMIRLCAPGHCGLAQPLSRVPSSRPLCRAAGHALLAFLRV